MTVIELAVLHAAKACEEQLRRGEGPDDYSEVLFLFDWADSVLQRLKERNSDDG